jgi:hypothetical protein
MVSGSITAEEAQSLSLPDLRRREYLSLRSLLHHSSLTSAAFAGALADPTGLLLIAALAAAAKEGIDGYEEWKYLAVLQGEVRRRGLEPCKATAMDQLETFFATFVGQEVQQVLGPGSDQFGDAAGEYAYDHMVEKAARKLECSPGGPPPNGCVRRNVKTRLQCDDCRTFFDTRFDSYSRELQPHFPRQLEK